MRKSIATAPGEETNHVDLTTQELAARQAEESQWESEKDVREWVDQIKETDKEMSRQIEDIIDALDTETRGRINTKTLSKYNNKKTVRARKPKK